MMSSCDMSCCGVLNGLKVSKINSFFFSRFVGHEWLDVSRCVNAYAPERIARFCCLVLVTVLSWGEIFEGESIARAGLIQNEQTHDQARSPARGPVQYSAAPKLVRSSMSNACKTESRRLLWGSPANSRARPGAKWRPALPASNQGMCS